MDPINLSTPPSVIETNPETKALPGSPTGTQTSPAEEDTSSVPGLTDSLVQAAGEFLATAYTPLGNMPLDLIGPIVELADPDSKKALRLAHNSFRVALNVTTPGFVLQNPGDMTAAKKAFLSAKSVTLEGSQFTDDDVSNLFRQLPSRCTELTLKDCPELTGAALRELPDNIRSFNISGCDGITRLEADLSHLHSVSLNSSVPFADQPLRGNLGNLQKLSLNGEFTDRALEGNWKSLRFLSVKGRLFSNRALENIKAKSENLESLSLNGPGFNDGTLANIKMENLQSLEIVNDRISDRALPDKLENLRNLSLRGAKFFRPLAGKNLKNLKSLSLSGQNLTNRALPSDSGNLRSLKLIGPKFAAGALADKKWGSLESLYLHNLNFKENPFKNRTEWPNLKSVELAARQSQSMLPLKGSLNSWGVSVELLSSW
jgi:hypothetical protein